MSDQRTSSTPIAESDNASSTAGSEADLRVESLVVGREKRSTAGTRLSKLVDDEKDDEIGMLFAEHEEEEDDSFHGDDEEASDLNLGSSSSDEEDREGARDNDELHGEKELERQNRQETKKRKAREKAKLPGVARKRVKIDPTAIKTKVEPQPRPKKKSERVSWVATQADAPTRVSSRKLTIQNRETVHKRLVDSEKQKKKLMHQMEQAQRRKEANKPKALTQEQRLEEAAKMEKENAKSLTRWEESEKKRVAEQKAKLEALHNRQLSGPLVSFWSGLARWVQSKVTQLGVKAIRDAGHKEEPNKRQEGPPFVGGPVLQQAGHSLASLGHAVMSTNLPYANPYQINRYAHATDSQNSYPQALQFTPPQGPSGFLQGIHAYAALPTHNQPGAIPPNAHRGISTPNMSPYSYTAPYSQPQPRIESEKEYTSRNLVALKNVDANAQKLSEFQYSALLKKNKTKLQRPTPEQCAITGQPAKYREPNTGLPYANAYAYQEIQRLRKGGSRWSNLLDCYVGSIDNVAKGVPERFQMLT